ncbi:hypothetical protein TNCV_4288801 [Trichonephila clavipes]|nr:hypothetical protein TNCV_4288801 [Trichonephila clavipes]
MRSPIREEEEEITIRIILKVKCYYRLYFPKNWAFRMICQLAISKNRRLCLGMGLPPHIIITSPLAAVGRAGFPGVDLSRYKDHVVFRNHRIACSRLRKVVRNLVPEKAYMRRDPL